MLLYQTKLRPKLFELFQHCQTKCTAGCCGWDAFDFSKNWLESWCDFRDNSIIREARSEIALLRAEIEGIATDRQVNIARLFASTAAVLLEHLDMIDMVLRTRDSDVHGSNQVTH